MVNIYDVYFKGQSTHDFELLTKDIGRRKKAEEKIERVPIPMRSGDLVIHTEEYESYERQMTFTALNKHELSAIYAWLDGYGILRTDQDEGGYFFASVTGDIDRVPTAPGINDLVVTFLVEPFFYLDDGERTIEITKQTTLVNLGSRESQPLIKVYGTGDIKLDVNSQVVHLTGVDGSIAMDSKLLVCYRDTLNQGKKMKGNYVRFDKGNNVIKWTGTVSKIEIVPRWCDK